MKYPQKNLLMGQCTLRNLDDYNPCGMVLLNHLDLLLVCGRLVLGVIVTFGFWSLEVMS